ncbi:MAG: cobalamin-binding protein [Bacteroidota bacterium]
MVPARTILHIHHSGRQRPGPVPALLRILCACFALLIPDQNAHGQIEVVDDMGRTVTLATSAQRIVSLAPSLTESLFAIGAGDQVVAVTDYCNHPPEAGQKPTVGGMTDPNIETIITLSPDLIVLSKEGNLKKDFDRLRNLNASLFVSNPRTLSGIRRSIRQLGTLTGHIEEADTLLASLEAREDSLRTPAGSPRVRTLLIVSLQPLIVVGKNTFINQLLEAAGAENLASVLSSPYPTYSREALAAEDPDVIIVISDALEDPSAPGRLFPEWERLSAMRNNRVAVVNADLVSRPGPRAWDGLEALVHILRRNIP